MENLLPTVKSISELVDDFKSGRIAVPEIQRDVVWKPDQVKELIDSVTNGFPCGSLIFWEPREKDKDIVRSIIRPERLEKSKGMLPTYFLLDGQQRLTALASVILKREELKDLLIELEQDMPYIYINLKRFKEMEATDTPAGYSFPWVLYNKLFEGTLWSDPDYDKLDSDKKEELRKYIQNVRDYKFPVQIIRGQNYQTVAEIFARVNSQGTQLTGAEIHLAKIVPHWRGITREFRDYRKELRDNFYDLGLDFLIRMITAIECDVPQIKKLSNKIANNEITKNKLNLSWKKAKSATSKMIRILNKELLLDKSKYVTSKNTLVPLVYYIAKEKRGVAISDIKSFFLLSQLSEHYGSAADSKLGNDFKILKEATRPRVGLRELVKNVDNETRQYYRALKIKSNEMFESPSKNVLVLLMYILMKMNKATDWGGIPRKTLGEIEPENMHLHHIFPFNHMIKDKKAVKKYEREGFTISEYRKDVNSMANLTFLSGEKNSSIGAVPPSQYLLNETTHEIRKAHFIPEDPELWKTENFRDFLEVRGGLIADAITRFVKKL